MDKALFERLAQSMSEMNEIAKGEREPSRVFEIDAMKIKEIRQSSGLSQRRFADLISVSVDTLRNREQGRRWRNKPGALAPGHQNRDYSPSPGNRNGLMELRAKPSCSMRASSTSEARSSATGSTFGSFS